jgi:hypothetical protein
MNDQQIGYIVGWGGGLLGILLGLGGAFLGTYIPYRQAESPRQRILILKSAVFFSIFVLVFLAGLTWTPSPWNFLLWILYVFVLLVSIAWFNKRHLRIVEDDADETAQAN